MVRSAPFGQRIAPDPDAEAFYLRLGARRVGEVASTSTGRTLPLGSVLIWLRSCYAPGLFRQSSEG